MNDIDIHEIGGCCDHCKSEIERGREELLNQPPDQLEELLAQLPRSSPLFQKIAADRARAITKTPPLPPSPLKHFSRSIKIEGKKGDRTSLSFDIEHLCRGERFFIIDGPHLDDVRVLALAGRQVPEQAQSAKKWTYEAQFLSCGMIIGSFGPNKPFTIEVEFSVDCTLEAQLIGVMARQ